MNDVASGRDLIAKALRRLMATIRETHQRVLAMYSPRPPEQPADEEAIHDFRVALRRSRTALRVAENIWNTKRLQRIERELRYYGRTTGLLRDDEVLLRTLDSLKPTETSTEETRVWMDKRSRKARSTQRSVRRIVHDGPRRGEATASGGKHVRPLLIVLDKLEEILDSAPSNNLSAQELAAVGVANAVREVRRAALGTQVHDVLAMHALRIREKRLRYTVELFPAELGDEGPRLQGHATRLQKRLGDLHDLDEAIGTMTRARGISRQTRYATLNALYAARAACAAKIEPHLDEARRLDAAIALSCNDSLPKSAT
jgi:CHAD domain-containing protein